MAIGRAYVWGRSGTNTATNPRNTIVAAEAVPAGYILAITDVQFSVGMLPTSFYLLDNLVDIAGYYCQEEKVQPAMPPFSYTRHYNVPIIVPGGHTIGMEVGINIGATLAYGSIIGEQSDLLDHTARRYGVIAMDGSPNAQPILPVAYTVPAGQKLSITDLDFSAVEPGGQPSPFIFEVRVNGTAVYYTQLMHGGNKMISLECPIEALAGQSVQLWVTDLGRGNPPIMGSFVGQLL